MADRFVFNPPVIVVEGLSVAPISVQYAFNNLTASVLSALNTLAVTPTGNAGGDLSGAYPNPVVSAVHAVAGTIDNVVIGALVPNAGTFTTLNANNSTLASLTLTNALTLFNGGTGATSSASARVNLGLGSLAVQNLTAAQITGGTIDGTVIGGTTPATGTFSSLNLSAPLAIVNGGTGNNTAASARVGLGLGTLSTQNVTSIAVTGGTIDGVTIGSSTPAIATFAAIGLNTALSVINGGTGGNTAALARTGLGLGTIATQAANAIAVTGGTLDGTVIGGVSPAAGTFLGVIAASMNGGQLAGMRNRIINGSMQIDQRNNGGIITPVSGQYVADRFGYYATAAGKVTSQQNTGYLGTFANYLNFTSTSAYAVTAGDYFYTSQAIEGLNAQDLLWGTANALPIVLSFTVYSSLTGTFGGAIRNSSGGQSYPFVYNIARANTATIISLSVLGPTSGTWLTTNGIGVTVGFGLGCGATYSGAAGVWSTNSSNYLTATGAVSVVGTSGATLNITGIQFELGTIATPFERLLYGTNLILSQRYYEIFYSAISNGNVTNNDGGHGGSYGFRTTKRTVPSIGFVAGSDSSTGFAAGAPTLATATVDMAFLYKLCNSTTTNGNWSCTNTANSDF